MACDIQAKIIEWTPGNNGKEVITLQLRYPLMIHAELMTHRDFSRNARSSRAVPVEKMIAEVRNSPMIPRFWGKNQKGMQASEDLSGLSLAATKFLWKAAARSAAGIASLMNRFGGHKQVINRILAPFLHIDVVVTTTELANFLWLRDHKDAEPHIHVLAQEIKRELLKWGSVGKSRNVYHLDPEAKMWHLPYVTDIERGLYKLDQLIIISVARCARVSYKAFDGTVSSFKADCDLVEKLIGSQPLHASPTEHQARPDGGRMREGKYVWKNPELHGNLHGFIQYRKLLDNEVKRSVKGL